MVVGPVFAVALVTALNWSLNKRRDDFLECVRRSTR